MKVLWVTNIILSDACKQMGLPVPVVGGWMDSLLKSISGFNGNIKFTVVSVHSGRDILEMNVNDVTYFLLPRTKSLSQLEKYWKYVCSKTEVDLFHIHGTECLHGMALMNVIPNGKFIISIQGLVSIYDRYFYAGISVKEIIKSLTLKDVLSGNSIFKRASFGTRGKTEWEYIRRTNHVIGRTTWDQAHTQTINPQVNYHFCNEVLRDSFYLQKWDFEKIQPYSIFLSQAGYPIKGLHMVLRALAILKKEFPQIHIFIGGRNIIQNSTLLDKLKLSGYSNYIKRLIKQFDLSDQITFLGPLVEDDMAKQLAKSHVFVCPSSIENSPNSLGEAQLVGTPVISSYVGGVPDMVEHNVSGILYRFEEYEMLAYYVKMLFNDRELALRLSKEGHAIAMKRHNKSDIAEKTLSIYKNVVGYD